MSGPADVFYKPDTLIPNWELDSGEKVYSFAELARLRINIAEYEELTPFESKSATELDPLNREIMPSSLWRKRATPLQPPKDLGKELVEK